MNTDEATAWLESELKGFPERASGEDLYQFFVRIARRPLSSDAKDRQAFVEALREWFRSRSEPRTMLAVEIAAVHGVNELRADIEALLHDVKGGIAFRPFYSENIERALRRISAVH